MKTILVLLFVSLTKIEAKISIDLNPNTENTTATYSGIVVEHASDDDIKTFFRHVSLEDAVKIHYEMKPTNVYFKKPTPWGDLYTRYNWEEVSKIVTIKSVTVKTSSTRHAVISTQTFSNFLDHPVKMNTGISSSVENSITTTWFRNKEFTVSQEIEYDVNVIFAKLAGNTGISFTSSWGKSEEKSESFTIGTTSGVETELKPGQTVTAQLSVNSGLLDIEVVYKAYLRGNLAVNLKKKIGTHHFFGPRVQDVMKSAGVLNEKTVKENILIGYNIDGKLEVFDKATGKVVKVV